MGSSISTADDPGQNAAATQRRMLGLAVIGEFGLWRVHEVAGIYLKAVQLVGRPAPQEYNESGESCEQSDGSHSDKAASLDQAQQDLAVPRSPDTDELPVARAGRTNYSVNYSQPEDVDSSSNNTAADSSDQLYLTGVRISRGEFFDVFGMSDFESMRKGGFLHLPLWVFDLFDTKGEGRIEIMQVLLALALYCKGSVVSRMDLCFEVFDDDGSGELDPDEMLILMSAVTSSLYILGEIKTRASHKLLQLVAQDMFQQADSDNSGTVSISEFYVWAQASMHTKTLVHRFKRARRDLARQALELQHGRQQMKPDWSRSTRWNHPVGWSLGADGAVVAADNDASASSPQSTEIETGDQLLNDDFSAASKTLRAMAEHLDDPSTAGKHAVIDQTMRRISARSRRKRALLHRRKSTQQLPTIYWSAESGFTGAVGVSAHPTVAGVSPSSHYSSSDSEAMPVHSSMTQALQAATQASRGGRRQSGASSTLSQALLQSSDPSRSPPYRSTEPEQSAQAEKDSTVPRNSRLRSQLNLAVRQRRGSATMTYGRRASWYDLADGQPGKSFHLFRRVSEAIVSGQAAKARNLHCLRVFTLENLQQLRRHGSVTQETMSSAIKSHTAFQRRASHGAIETIAAVQASSTADQRRAAAKQSTGAVMRLLPALLKSRAKALRNKVQERQASLGQTGDVQQSTTAARSLGLKQLLPKLSKSRIQATAPSLTPSTTPSTTVQPGPAATLPRTPSPITPRARVKRFNQDKSPTQRTAESRKQDQAVAMDVPPSPATLAVASAAARTPQISGATVDSLPTPARSFPADREVILRTPPKLVATPPSDTTAESSIGLVPLTRSQSMARLAQRIQGRPTSSTSLAPLLQDSSPGSATRSIHIQTGGRHTQSRAGSRRLPYRASLRAPNSAGGSLTPRSQNSQLPAADFLSAHGARPKTSPQAEASSKTPVLQPEASARNSRPIVRRSRAAIPRDTQQHSWQQSMEAFLGPVGRALSRALQRPIAHVPAAKSRRAQPSLDADSVMDEILRGTAPVDVDTATFLQEERAEVLAAAQVAMQPTSQRPAKSGESRRHRVKPSPVRQSTASESRSRDSTKLPGLHQKRSLPKFARHALSHDELTPAALDSLPRQHLAGTRQLLTRKQR